MNRKQTWLRLSFALVSVFLAAALTGCGDDGSSSGNGGNGGSGGSGGSGANGGSGGSGGGTTSGAQTVTIAAARALPDGETATVEGYVTVVPGTFNSATGDNGFGIQDESGGVYVGIADLLDFPLDQKVRVTGKLSQVAQQTVLAAAKEDVSAIEGMTQTITSEFVKTGDVKEAVEGLLIRVSGKVTQAVQDDSPYGMKVFIDDGSGEIQVFAHLVGGEPVIDTASLMVDQTIMVVGTASQYETTYEVTPRNASDLTKM